MLPEEINKLLSQAKVALSRSIASSSGFSVGAALLSDDGRIFTGCNVENPSLMLSMCAERIAILKALSEGSTSFVAMAIVSEDEGECFPCGACRQMIFEFAPNISIYLESRVGLKKYSIRELIPYPFKK